MLVGGQVGCQPDQRPHPSLRPVDSDGGAQSLSENRPTLVRGQMGRQPGHCLRPASRIRYGLGVGERTGRGPQPSLDESNQQRRGDVRGQTGDRAEEQRVADLPAKPPGIIRGMPRPGILPGGTNIGQIVTRAALALVGDIPDALRPAITGGTFRGQERIDRLRLTRGQQMHDQR